MLPGLDRWRCCLATPTGAPPLTPPLSRQRGRTAPPHECVPRGHLLRRLHPSVGRAGGPQQGQVDLAVATRLLLLAACLGSGGMGWVCSGFIPRLMWPHHLPTSVETTLAAHPWTHAAWRLRYRRSGEQTMPREFLYSVCVGGNSRLLLCGCAALCSCMVWPRGARILDFSLQPQVPNVSPLKYAGTCLGTERLEGAMIASSSSHPVHNCLNFHPIITTR